jgi:hypothetical protein
MPKKREPAPRVGIFYISIPKKGEGPNWSTKGSPVRIGKGFPAKFVFVRVQPVRASLLDALNKAKPRRGESVMNTHYIG